MGLLCLVTLRESTTNLNAYIRKLRNSGESSVFKYMSEGTPQTCYFSSEKLKRNDCVSGYVKGLHNTIMYGHR
jgi:hypothetical protein